MRTSTTAWVAAGLLLLAALPAAAKPSFTEQNDRLELANGNIVVSFHGKKPKLQVQDADNASRGYMVFLQRLVEVPPGADLTGAREVASFDLTGAEAWAVNHTEDEAGITLTLHREGPIRFKPGNPQVPLPPEVQNLTGNRTTGNASITFVFHISEAERQVQVGNETLNVTAHEAKFDVVVERWDWASRADVLALEFLLVDQEEGNGTAGTAVNASANRVVARSGGEEVGFVSWVAMATATTNGTAAEAPVEHRSGGSGKAEHDEARGAKHWLVYQAPGFDRLVHDPSVGLEPEPGDEAPPGGSARTPGPGLALLLLAAPAAAVAARRRP